MARRNETSNELVEVRTVLSRAITARDSIVDWSYRGNIVRDQQAWDDAEKVYAQSRTGYVKQPMPHYWPHEASGETPDLDSERMYAALTQTISTLMEWQGKKKRRR